MNIIRWRYPADIDEVVSTLQEIQSNELSQIVYEIHSAVFNSHSITIIKRTSLFPLTAYMFMEFKK